MVYEYKVVPAPKKGKRAKGVKGAEARFATALSEVMNELGAEGWEYQRSDTLPCETRSGLASRTTVFQNMLVFRRIVNASDAVVNDPAPSPAAIVVEEIAETHAPALPAPKQANAMPDHLAALDGADEKPRDLPAE